MVKGDRRTMKLGDFELNLLSDGFFSLDGGQIFGVIPRILWEKKIAPDGLNRIRLALNSLLVRTGDHTVLIETGIGNRMDEKSVGIYDVQKPTDLLKDLEKCGVAPEDVDVVINTHLHFDHCGWNLMPGENGDLVPTFPRARYYVQKGEWEHALAPSDRDRASYRKDYFLGVRDRVTLLEGGQEIIPGIRVEVFSGHTRHLQGVWITSKGQEALFISDLSPTAANIPYVWIPALDTYPMETLENKKRVLPELARRRTLVIFVHETQTPLVRLRDGGRNMEVEPVQI